MKRTIPDLRTDAEAETFLAQDLSGLDFTQFKPVDLAATGDASTLTVRMPRALLDAVKRRAKARGISHTRYIRELIARDIGHG